MKFYRQRGTRYHPTFGKSSPSDGLLALRMTVAKAFPRMQSSQPRDRFAAVDVVRPVLGVVPGRCRGQAQGLVDRGGEVLGGLGIGAGKPPILSDEPTTRPPWTPPPARKTVCTLPQWSRPGSL